jgi:hypothetical protein
MMVGSSQMVPQMSGLKRVTSKVWNNEEFSHPWIGCDGPLPCPLGPLSSGQQISLLGDTKEGILRNNFSLRQL